MLTREQTQAEAAISIATRQLLINQPFFGVVLLSLKVEPIDGATWPADLTQTMATDGKRLVYGAAYVLGLTAKKRVGLLAHEVLHLAYLHHTRRVDRDARLWNVACLTGDTPILMADGSERAIVSLCSGELIWSPSGPSRVLELVSKGRKKVLSLRHGGREIRCTEDHRFLTESGFIDASLQNSRRHGQILRATGGYGLRAGKLPRQIDSGIVQSNWRNIHECSASSIYQRAKRESLCLPAQNNRCSDGYDKDGVSLFGWDRRWGGHNNLGSKGRRVWEYIFSTIRDNLEHIRASRGLAEIERVCHSFDEKFKWSPLLADQLEWLFSGHAFGPAYPSSCGETVSRAIAFGVHIDTAREVEIRAANGAYARDCLDFQMAERAHVSFGRARGADEVFDLVTEHHVFSAGGLLTHNCDYAIDRDLTASGFDVPDPLIDARFAGLNAEAIYAVLKRENCQQKQKPGGIIDAAPPTEPGKLQEAEAEAQKIIRQAVMATRASGPGAPAAIVRMVDALTKPRVNWREHIWDFAGSSDRSDYTWAKPNRRHLGRGLILPSLRPLPGREIVGAIDTSGSMDKAAVAAGVTEFQAMLDEGAVDRLWLVYCDSDIQGFEEYEGGDVIKPEIPGGGGTRFSPVWPWVRAHCPEASRIVYFTDMGSSDYGSPPDIPVLWARYGSTREAPFGEHMDVDADA